MFANLNFKLFEGSLLSNSASNHASTIFSQAVSLAVGREPRRLNTPYFLRTANVAAIGDSNNNIDLPYSFGFKIGTDYKSIYRDLIGPTEAVRNFMPLVSFFEAENMYPMAFDETGKLL